MLNVNNLFLKKEVTCYHGFGAKTNLYKILWYLLINKYMRPIKRTVQHENSNFPALFYVSLCREWWLLFGNDNVKRYFVWWIICSDYVQFDMCTCVVDTDTRLALLWERTGEVMQFARETVNWELRKNLAYMYEKNDQ